MRTIVGRGIELGCVKKLAGSVLLKLIEDARSNMVLSLIQAERMIIIYIRHESLKYWNGAEE